MPWGAPLRWSAGRCLRREPQPPAQHGSCAAERCRSRLPVRPGQRLPPCMYSGGTSRHLFWSPQSQARARNLSSCCHLCRWRRYIDVEWPPEDYHRWQRTRVQRTMHPVPFELKALSAEQRVVDTSLCHRHLLYGRHLHGTALDTSLCLERAKGAISNTHASSLSSYDSPPPACRATSFHLATLYLGRGMGR